jgi:hypothetical protein
MRNISINVLLLVLLAILFALSTSANSVPDESKLPSGIYQHIYEGACPKEIKGKFNDHMITKAFHLFDLCREYHDKAHNISGSYKLADCIESDGRIYVTGKFYTGPACQAQRFRRITHRPYVVTNCQTEGYTEDRIYKLKHYYFVCIKNTPPTPAPTTAPTASPVEERPVRDEEARSDRDEEEDKEEKEKETSRSHNRQKKRRREESRDEVEDRSEEEEEEQPKKAKKPKKKRMVVVQKAPSDPEEDE